MASVIYNTTEKMKYCKMEKKNINNHGLSYNIIKSFIILQNVHNDKHEPPVIVADFQQRDKFKLKIILTNGPLKPQARRQS